MMMMMMMMMVMMMMMKYFGAFNLLKLIKFLLIHIQRLCTIFWHALASHYPSCRHFRLLI